jgi:transposase
LESNAAHLGLDQQFMSARFRAHPIIRLFEFASTELHIALSSRSIAEAFEVSRSAIARAKLRGSDDPPGRGRHHQFDAESEQEFIDCIANRKNMITEEVPIGLAP